LPGKDGVTFIREATLVRPGLVFLVHTGSVDEGIVLDGAVATRVSPRLFRKPLADLGELAREIHRMLEDKE